MDNKIILNYTPHTVTIVNNDGEVIKEYPPIGEIRCKQETKIVGSINEVPIASTSFGDIITITNNAIGQMDGLPEKNDKFYYIVSRIVKQAAPGREDLLVPNDLVRNADGIIIGCKSLANN